MRHRPWRSDRDEFARQHLTFPPVDLRNIGSAELVGYYSYLNWLLPDRTLDRPLKLSLLLFDKIIAETPSDNDPEEALHHLVAKGKLTKVACAQLLGLIVPITTIVPRFGGRDLFTRSGDAFLESATEVAIDEEYISRGRVPPDEEDRDFKDIRYMVTDASFGNWFALSRQAPCLFIPNGHEEPILKNFLNYQSSNDRDYYKFKSVVTRLLPTVDEFSIEDIFALRKHEYFASFRAKTRQLVEHLSSVDGDKEAHRVIEDQERKDLKTLQDLYRPHPVRTILRAVIGNIPLPSVVNPVAVYDNVVAIRRELKVKREVGWLYFVRDASEGTV